MHCVSCLQMTESAGTAQGVVGHRCVDMFFDLQKVQGLFCGSRFVFAIGLR